LTATHTPPSLTTRRSSDLIPALAAVLAATPLAAQNVSGYRYLLRMTSSNGENVVGTVRLAGDKERIDFPPGARTNDDGYILLLKDRKSTRLNSSHLGISYA